MEERRPHRDFLAAHPLAQNRKERSPQHRERDADEQQIVVEKGRLTTHHAFQPRLRLEVLEARRDEIGGDRDRDGEKRGKPAADG